MCFIASFKHAGIISCVFESLRKKLAWIYCTSITRNSSYIFYFCNCITSEVGTIQGEVEQISLMKPKAQGPHDEGFLEYLEDIIGTNQYVEKIDEAYKQ